MVGIVLVLSTFRDYGVTWDEDVHNWYGNFVLDYYLSLFGDKTALHWRDLYNYGAVFDMVAAALNRVSPIGVYETRHLLNGLVGILGLIGCWKLARAMAGRPRRVYRGSISDFDAELLRADVQQPKGHTVRGRHCMEHLLHGPNRADAAPASSAGCWPNSVWRSA